MDWEREREREREREEELWGDSRPSLMVNENGDDRPKFRVMYKELFLSFES